MYNIIIADSGAHEAPFDFQKNSKDIIVTGRGIKIVYICTITMIPKSLDAKRGTTPSVLTFFRHWEAVDQLQVQSHSVTTKTTRSISDVVRITNTESGL